MAQKNFGSKQREDSTKRIGNHSFDQQVQMEMLVHKNPVTGNFIIIEGDRMPQPYSPVVTGNHMVPEPPKNVNKPGGFTFKKNDQTPKRTLKDDNSAFGKK